jgi:hypothetical protein
MLGCRNAFRMAALKGGHRRRGDELAERPTAASTASQACWSFDGRKRPRRPRAWKAGPLAGH